MKNKLIIGNWKQNPENIAVAHELLEISKKYSQELLTKNIFITHAVPNIFIGILMNEKEELILQNISCFEGGSHTGEISAMQAKSLGINMSLVGHSETRLSPENPHGDEDIQINMKIRNLLKQEMQICLCVGEYKREDDYLEIIKTQIDKDFFEIKIADLEKIIIAYEPVWAIGKNAVRPATEEEIFETIKSIKEYLKSKYGEAGQNIKILYGGSVDQDNIAEIIDIDLVDGTLVGRASSNKESWEKLLQNLKQF